jgi:NADH dehydrogenase
MDEDTTAATPRVLIIGGGFGGMFAARRLLRTPAEVTLLDRSTSNLFQPLLYQCATGLLSEGKITMPLRTLLAHQRNARVLQGEATAVDPTARKVTATRADGSTFDLGYDYLIVAAGMRQSYFGHDEFATYAPGLKTLDDALTIRRRVLSAFEMAETLPDAEARREWLTFAIVGAGATGVELAGQIRELADHTIANEFHAINPKEARVLLFDGGDRILTAFGSRLSAKATTVLERMSVDVHLGVMVTDLDDTGLTTKDSKGNEARHAARTVLWTAGVEAVPFASVVAKALGVGQDRQGRIAVNPDLTVPGHPHVWVVGDLMALEKLPGVAEVALQGGLYAAGEINRRITKDTTSKRPFRYHDLGNAAYISRGHAVVDAGPLKLSGFFGWVIWGFIHIGFLAGIRNRLSTISTWMLALARGKRPERAILYHDPDHPRPA